MQIIDYSMHGKNITTSNVLLFHQVKSICRSSKTVPCQWNGWTYKSIIYKSLTS